MAVAPENDALNPYGPPAKSTEAFCAQSGQMTQVAIEDFELRTSCLEISEVVRP